MRKSSCLDYFCGQILSIFLRNAKNKCQILPIKNKSFSEEIVSLSTSRITWLQYNFAVQVTEQASYIGQQMFEMSNRKWRSEGEMDWISLPIPINWKILFSKLKTFCFSSVGYLCLAFTRFKGKRRNLWSLVLSVCSIRTCQFANYCCRLRVAFLNPQLKFNNTSERVSDY